MASKARARSTWAAGALSERLRRVKAIRSSGVSGRRGSFWRRDMVYLDARGSPATIPNLTANDPLDVWSRALMVHSSRWNGRMRYGPSSAWERPHDGGGPSSDPAESREPEEPGQATRDQSEDCGQVEEARLGGRPSDRAQAAP